LTFRVHPQLRPLTRVIRFSSATTSASGSP
jgi:hypothetical protein